MENLQQDREHSNSPSNAVEGGQEKEALGPECQYCHKNLLEPTATFCNNCGHMHRNTSELDSEKDAVSPRQTSSGEAQTTERKIKYAPVFGPQADSQVRSLPMTKSPTSQVVQKNNPPGAPEEETVTVSDFVERLKKGTVSAAAEATAPKGVSAEMASAVDKLLKSHPRKRKSSSSDEQFLVKHFKSSDESSDNDPVDLPPVALSGNIAPDNRQNSDNDTKTRDASSGNPQEVCIFNEKQVSNRSLTLILEILK